MAKSKKTTPTQEITNKLIEAIKVIQEAETFNRNVQDSSESPYISSEMDDKTIKVKLSSFLNSYVTSTTTTEGNPIVVLNFNADMGYSIEIEFDDRDRLIELRNDLMAHIDDWSQEPTDIVDLDEDSDEDYDDTDEMTLEEDIESTEEEEDEDEEVEGPLMRYEVKGERVLNSAWTYYVNARSEEEAIEMVENCPDGYCDEVIHNDDETVYEDEITYEVIGSEEIVEEPKKMKAKKKKK